MQSSDTDVVETFYAITHNFSGYDCLFGHSDIGCASGDDYNRSLTCLLLPLEPRARAIPPSSSIIRRYPVLD